jgi:hypothetical protein
MTLEAAMQKNASEKLNATSFANLTDSLLSAHVIRPSGFTSRALLLVSQTLDCIN